jgi:hypothetical protein
VLIFTIDALLTRCTQTGDCVTSDVKSRSQKTFSSVSPIKRQASVSCGHDRDSFNCRHPSRHPEHLTGGCFQFTQCIALLYNGPTYNVILEISGSSTCLLGECSHYFDALRVHEIHLFFLVIFLSSMCAATGATSASVMTERIHVHPRIRFLNACSLVGVVSFYLLKKGVWNPRSLNQRAYIAWMYKFAQSYSYILDGHSRNSESKYMETYRSRNMRD